MIAPTQFSATTQRRGRRFRIDLGTNSIMHMDARNEVNPIVRGAIDADGHLLEPPDLWEKYIDPRYRDRAIRVANLGGHLKTGHTGTSENRP
jgi:hypothetical protein